MLNAGTHGLGFLLALLGSPALMRRARATSASQSAGSHGSLAAALYCFSLCLLYFSSTAYHSGFKLRASHRKREFPGGVPELLARSPAIPALARCTSAPPLPRRRGRGGRGHCV